MTSHHNESRPEPKALALAVTGGDATLTMSSLEIAELTGKQHGHVMRDIRNMLESLENGLASNFGGYYTAENGKQNPCFRLPKRECMILVSGYSIPLRAKIVDRWMELEATVAAQPAVDPMKMLNDPVALRGLLSDYAGRVVELEKKVGEMVPQVAKLERLEGAKGSMCITDAAKTLGMRPIDLIRFMEGRRWIYKRPGNKNWVAFEDKRRAGLMEHDDHIYQGTEGQERVATRALVTAKGLVKLAELLNQPLH